jgi:protein subunit release factor B
MSAFPPPDVRAHLVTLGCDPAEVEESFTHAGGPGGQNVNKVATCVRLSYPARQVVVKMQEHRTQSANRLAAWRLLAATLQRARDQEKLARRSAHEKARRQKAQRPRGIKRQFVELKRRRAKTKQGRGKPGSEE